MASDKNNRDKGEPAPWGQDQAHKGSDGEPGQQDGAPAPEEADTLARTLRMVALFKQTERNPSLRGALEDEAVDEDSRHLLQTLDYFGSRDPGTTQRPDLADGHVVEGTVIEVGDLSVFVDLGGGATGLIHISDLTRARIKHPSEMVELGQQIRVKVLHNPPNSRVIHLGLKQLAPNPWDTAEERFPPGTRVEATVEHRNRNGVWFELEDGLKGMMARRNLDRIPGMDPGEVFRRGRTVTMTVQTVMPDAEMILFTWEPELWQEREGSGEEESA